MSERMEAIRAALRRVPVWAWAVAGLVVVGGCAVLRGGSERTEDAGLVFEARRGPLTISLVESGTIQSREQVVTRSEVEGRNTIIFLVEEGRQVAEGELLVELDASRLEESRVEQDIRVQNAGAQLIQARESLEVTRNQAQSDMEQAELNLRFARLDLQKFEEGEYPQQLQQAEADITIVQEELQRAQDTLEWSRKLAADGYITRSELQADELALHRRSVDLDLARGRRDLLQQYTYTQSLERLQSDIKQAEMALERVRRKASADVIRAEVDLRAKQSAFDQQKAKLEKTVEQIAKCRITAPSAGMAVYATTVRPRRWGQTEPLQVGQEVVERAELIYLPAATGMKAEIKVQEASLTKIRLGQPARITIDALPGRLFPGRLSRIGVLPDSQDRWMNPDLKQYNCDVLLDDGVTDLRPGMSCRVEVLVEEYADAVYVPLQCVQRVNAEPTVYLADARRGPTPRTVRTGLDNNRMVHVLEGLEGGEPVLLAPPLAPAESPAAAPWAAASEGADARATPPARPEEAAPETRRPAGAGSPPETAPPAGRRGGRRPGGAGGGAATP